MKVVAGLVGVAVSLAATVAAFATGALVSGSWALALCTAFAAWTVQAWRRLDATVDPEAEAETTIDLRHPLPRPATHDPVTGLVERDFFRVTLSQRVASARRHLQPVSLVVFEIDGFERVKPDRRDRALRLLAGMLRQTLRDCDMACRYGDHAVAALLEDTPEVGAATAAERVRRAVATTPQGRTFTLSAGIACYPSHALDANDLLRRSMQALATARAGGRDRVEIAPGD